MPNITFAQRNAELDHHNATMLIRIAAETSTSDLPLRQAKGATAGGDSRKLRGIPAIGRSVAGAQAGTIPGRSRTLDEWPNP